MAVPRYLILTPVVPGSRHVGEIFMREFCARYPLDKQVFFNVGKRPPPPLPPEFAAVPLQFVRQPLRRAFGRLPTFTRSLAKTTYEAAYIDRYAMPRLIEQAVSFGKAQGVEAILCALHSPPLIKMAKPTADALGLPLTTMVWDPPESDLPQYTIEGAVYQQMLDAFGDALRASERCGVASQNMADSYSSKYGVPCFPLIISIDPVLWRTPRKKADATFTIGFAGGLYARREWEALLEALAQINWTLDGRAVSIRYMGIQLNAVARVPARIEYLGWRSMSETVELLSEVDAAYLPYWFDAERAPSVKLCFPNKLSTYLAAGVPVLYHGPADSSPTRFLSEYPAGVTCHSLEPDALIDALRKLMHGDAAAFAQAGRRALEEALNPDVFRRRVAQTMGVDENELMVSEAQR
jgi:glycosyltransferase involved in cell wall biosynthesis